MLSALILLLIISIKSGFMYENYFKPQFIERNERNCLKLLQEPNYEDNLVINQFWREYYSWRSVSKNCQITHFLAATSELVHRFESEMTDFVQEQPVWEDATMMAKSGKYEMLMFHDEEGPTGTYKGIPNYAKFGDLYEYAHHRVIPLKFAMKLVRGNKFLVMLDCMSGLGHVMARDNDTVKEAEILSVAEEVDLGKGYISCVSYISN